MVKTALDQVLRLPSPLVEIRDRRFGSVRVFLKRDDMIHPEISGNKGRKLKYIVADAVARGARTLLTFGGAYSNHIGAVAAVGDLLGLDTIGVIRGDERPFNSLLERAIRHGMRLHYIDRATYRRKAEPDVLDRLRSELGDFYLIPEGGSSPLALRGCAELIYELEVPFDVVTCPVGTGGTLAGLSASLVAGQRAIGFAVLRGAKYLNDEVERLHKLALAKSFDNWTIDHRFHCGGFARSSPTLEEFIEDFSNMHGIRLERTYVAKMMIGLTRQIGDGEIPNGSRVIAVITGSAVLESPMDLPTAGASHPT